MQYWLLKTEPDTYSFADLNEAPKQISGWEGVRNYQARNMLRDQMQVGDLAFFYHSSCKVPGIAGIVKVIKSGYPDTTAFDPSSPYYDGDTSPQNPRWYCVDVQLVRPLKRFICLDELRKNSVLNNMILLRKGNRLSITPITANEWQAILKME